MEIDPVVLLAEELRATESALQSAVQRYEVDHLRENGEKVSELLKSIKALYRDLAETEPTSAMGAGEMVRLAAQHLPFALARYADQFDEVAARHGDDAQGERRTGQKSHPFAEAGDRRRRPAGDHFPRPGAAGKLNDDALRLILAH
jgi:hypothetical protein